MSEIIPYALPSITELEIDYVKDAISHGWGESRSKYLELLEEMFREVIGVDKAIATSSCTGALHLGLSALGIGDGDEVILADTNWIATVAPVVHLGAIPVFVDIDPESWCIDPKKIEDAITPRTKAVIATHLYGNLADLDEIQKVISGKEIFLIEDAAEAIGSSYRGKPAGSFGIFGVFSFHGSKTVTTGEGGCLVTSDSKFYEKAIVLSNHGRSDSDPGIFSPQQLGYKFKMSNVQAAIGCAQIERINELVSRKQQILESYRKALAVDKTLKLNPIQNDCENGAWMPTLIVEGKSSEASEVLEADLRKSGIDARPVFKPLTSLPMFRANGMNVNSLRFSQMAINLPSFHTMSEVQFDFIVDSVFKVIKTLD